METMTDIAKELCNEAATKPIEALIRIKAGRVPGLRKALRDAHAEVGDDKFRTFHLLVPDGLDLLAKVAAWKWNGAAGSSAKFVDYVKAVLARVDGLEPTSR